MHNLVQMIHCCTTDDNADELVEVLQKTWFNSVGGLCLILRKHHCHNDNDEACGSVRKVFKESVAIITIIITNIMINIISVTITMIITIGGSVTEVPKEGSHRGSELLSALPHTPTAVSSVSVSS